MFALLLSALAVSALLSAALAVAVSELRQRSAQPEAQEEEVRVPGVATGGTKQKVSSGKSSFLASSGVGILLVLACAFSYYRYQLRGAQARVKICQPTTAAERLELFGDLFGFHHPISTASHEAQALFNQGLLLAWDFDQPEAENAFRLAAKADPNASRPHWGIAYVIGPGANRAALPDRPTYPAFAPDQFPTVQSEARLALKLARIALAENPGSKEAVKDLAYAQAAVTRWPDGSAISPGRDAAEVAYSDALKAYGDKENDAAALAMAAEALMNLNPWDYYLSSGKMKDSSHEAEQLILQALDIEPSNPLANHLLIHISEASSPLRSAPLSASRALTAANRMAFGSGAWQAHQGHLLHMPSHTFVRTGQWHDAVVANINAFNADLQLGQHCLLPYEPEHNTDMLIYAASMGGQFKIAEEFAHKIRNYMEVMMPDPGDITFNWAKLPLLLAHYGRWRDIMAVSRPSARDRANCPSGGNDFAVTVWRYVRVLALAARAQGLRQAGNVQEFTKLDVLLQSYLEQLQAAEAEVVQEEPCYPPAVYVCEHKGVAQAYVLIAQARLALLRGDSEDAITKLRTAVALEDNFQYMEPPRMYQPLRQCLGWVLLNSSRPEEAEQVYAEDLGVYPNNGWSLNGLAASYHAQGRFAELDGIKERVLEAWKVADVQVETSCLAFSKPWDAAGAL